MDTWNFYFRRDPTARTPTFVPRGRRSVIAYGSAGPRSENGRVRRLRCRTGVLWGGGDNEVPHPALVRRGGEGRLWTTEWIGPLRPFWGTPRGGLPTRWRREISSHSDALTRWWNCSLGPGWRSWTALTCWPTGRTLANWPRVRGAVDEAVVC